MVLGISAQPEEVETQAERLRRLWRLGLDAISNMTELLESQGIKVVLIGGEIWFDGLLATVHENRPVIVIGKEWPGERQRMTLAHELGHLILRPTGDRREQEIKAKRFGGAFLVPAEAARVELGSHRKTLDWGDLFTLKRKHGVGMRAWLIRAKDLEIIKENRYVSLLKYYNKRGWNRGEPFPLRQEEPTRFMWLPYQALAEAFIREAKAAELDGLPLRAFLKTMAEGGPTLPTILVEEWLPGGHKGIRARFS